MVNYNKSNAEVKKGCYVMVMLNYSMLCYKGLIRAYLVYPATLHIPAIADVSILNFDELWPIKFPR